MAEYSIKLLYGIFVKEGDAVIDCGANWGLHTYLLMQLVGKSGKVYAFEAIPELAAKLQNYGEPISVYCGAVTSQETAQEKEYIKFFQCEEDSGYSSIIHENIPSSWHMREIMCPTMTIDSTILNRKNKISFIKLDLEGGEFDALKGAQRIMRDDKPIIAFEFSRRRFSSYNYTCDDFFSFFINLGYKLFTFDGRLYTQSLWDQPPKDIYWQLFAVHENSSAFNFFLEHLHNYIYSFMWIGREIENEYMSRTDHSHKILTSIKSVLKKISNSFRR